jgi:hypothetical protein
MPWNVCLVVKKIPSEIVNPARTTDIRASLAPWKARCINTILTIKPNIVVIEIQKAI